MASYSRNGVVMVKTDELKASILIARSGVDIHFGMPAYTSNTCTMRCHDAKILRDGLSRLIREAEKVARTPITEEPAK